MEKEQCRFSSPSAGAQNNQIDAARFYSGNAALKTHPLLVQTVTQEHIVCVHRVFGILLRKNGRSLWSGFYPFTPSHEYLHSLASDVSRDTRHHACSTIMVSCSAFETVSGNPQHRHTCCGTSHDCKSINSFHSSAQHAYSCQHTPLFGK